MTFREHLESIEPGLYLDALERACIRIEDGGQEPKQAMRDAYRETCRRNGVEPHPEAKPS